MCRERILVITRREERAKTYGELRRTVEYFVIRSNAIKDVIELINLSKRYGVKLY
jgi:hypothetical protein